MLKNCTGFYLHDRDRSVCDRGPVDGAHHDPSGGEGAGLRDEAVCQVQDIHHGTWKKSNAAFTHRVTRAPPTAQCSTQTEAHRYHTPSSHRVQHSALRCLQCPLALGSFHTHILPKPSLAVDRKSTNRCSHYRALQGWSLSMSSSAQYNDEELWVSPAVRWAQAAKLPLGLKCR